MPIGISAALKVFSKISKNKDEIIDKLIYEVTICLSFV